MGNEIPSAPSIEYRETHGLRSFKCESHGATITDRACLANYKMAKSALRASLRPHLEHCAGLSHWGVSRGREAEGQADCCAYRPCVPALQTQIRAVRAGACRMRELFQSLGRNQARPESAWKPSGGASSTGTSPALNHFRARRHAGAVRPAGRGFVRTPFGCRVFSAITGNAEIHVRASGFRAGRQ